MQCVSRAVCTFSFHNIVLIPYCCFVCSKLSNAFFLYSFFAIKLGTTVVWYLPKKCIHFSIWFILAKWIIWMRFCTIPAIWKEHRLVIRQPLSLKAASLYATATLTTQSGADKRREAPSLFLSNSFSIWSKLQACFLHLLMLYITCTCVCSIFTSYL